MAAIQLNFTLRTSQKCKTVHLVGSWDNYKSNLPLNKDPQKPGGWKGAFRFSQPTLLHGSRYWYYYIIDGCHVSHDPARDHTVEPTTGRKLNILDIPAPKPTHAPPPRHPATTISGRSLSPSQIQSPLPSRPYETHLFHSDTSSARDMEVLARRYAAQRLAAAASDTSSAASDTDSDGDSAGAARSASSSSLGSAGRASSGGSSRTSNSSSPDSVGGRSALGGCVCSRFAVMGSGERVRIDCGGVVCGSDGSEQSGEEERRRRAGAEKKRGGGKHHSSSAKQSSARKVRGRR